MSREPMPVPILYRILFGIDFLTCGIYGYILVYLLQEQGKSLFALELEPERIECFLVAGIAFFGFIGNLQMLRGRIRALFFCYVNWFLGLGFFLTGFFSGIIFSTLPKAMPSYLIPQEWLLGNIFMKTLAIRAGFLGLYLATILRITSVYSYFSRIQKEQAEKDRSGDSIGSFRQAKKLDIPNTPDSLSPFYYQDTDDSPEAKPVSLPKKHGFFRKFFAAMSILSLLSLASGIALAFFAPETYQKIYKETQQHLPFLQHQLESVLGRFFPNASVESYNQLLEKKIALRIQQANPVTISQAIEEICILIEMPYLAREVQGSKTIVGAIVLPDAKASSILEILTTSRRLQYCLCPKGLYLKEEKEMAVDWTGLYPTEKTAKFLNSSQK